VINGKKHLKLKNFSIGQFNQDVNRSHDPDEKYHRWAVYRQQISALIAGTWHQSIVLGAGSLNDVDLALLSSASDRVVLVDIDTDAVQKGIERQRLSPELRQKLEIVQHDFSGASSARLFEKLETAVQLKSPVEKIITILVETLSVMKPEPLLPGQYFDLVLSCPVYTQLVYTQVEVLLKILHATGLYTYDELNRVLISAHQGMQTILARYNDLMQAVLDPDGRLIVLADVLELQVNDPSLATLTALFEQKVADDSLIQPLLDQQGLELALNGLADLAARLETLDTRYFLWPFDAAKSYIVRGLICRRK
jgi:hypothetical protein